MSAMNKELKQVRDALQNLMTHSNPRLEQKYADAIKVGVEALATLDRIIASGPVMKIEGLEEAVAEYDKDGWNLHDETLVVLVNSARAYLELQNATTEKQK